MVHFNDWELSYILTGSYPTYMWELSYILTGSYPTYLRLSYPQAKRQLLTLAFRNLYGAY